MRYALLVIILLSIQSIINQERSREMSDKLAELEVAVNMSAEEANTYLTRASVAEAQLAELREIIRKKRFAFINDVREFQEILQEQGDE